MPVELHDRLEQLGRDLRHEIRPITPVELHPRRHRPDRSEPASSVTLEPTARSDRHRRWPFRAAMAAAVVVAVGTGLIFTQRNAAPQPAASNPPNAPSVAPVVPDPPAWVGTVLPGARQDDRRGTWTAAAIGQPTDDGGINDPIAITSFDQAYPTPGPATAVTIDGAALQLVEIDDWKALITTSSPTVMVSGRTDQATLAAVLQAVSVDDTTLDLGELPAGYTVLVPPTALAEPAEQRATLVGLDGRVSVSDVSDWVDPTLQAAMIGADVTPITIGPGSGWTGRTSTLTFVVWSPAPGIVFEADSDDPTISSTSLAELAAAVRAVDLDEWRAQNPGLID